MAAQKQHSVAILGDDMAALSIAYHLIQLGILDITLVKGVSSRLEKYSGFVCGGLLENFTRTSEAHGDEFASELWRLGDEAYATLKQFSRSLKIPYFEGPRLRFITSEAEHIECTKAVAKLKKNGWAKASLESSASPKIAEYGLGKTFDSRVTHVQTDGTKGGFVDAVTLCTKLEAIIQETIGSKGSSSGVPEPGKTSLQYWQDRAELVVVTDQSLLLKELGALSEALVPVSDQWMELPCGTGSQIRVNSKVGAKTGMPTGMQTIAGLCYSGNHTYEWGVITPWNSLRAGGSRFLRPLAGIGEPDPQLLDKVAKHIATTARQTLTSTHFGEPLHHHLVRELQTCDELPLVGPLFGDATVLIATGFMGQDLTLGLLAGQYLAKLIATGESAIVPRRLWPERLRTLPAST